jgi:hypothetical protein
MLFYKPDVYLYLANLSSGTEIQTGRKKERGTAKEEMEGQTPL